jgi:DNA-binding PadR family transcriptional regulator
MLTDLEFALLSHVADAPQYGAQIEARLSRDGVYDGTPVDARSVFHMLGNLMRRGLVSASLEPDPSAEPAARDERMRAALVYITDGGRGVLQTAVSERLSQPRALGAGFEMGLAHLHVLKPAQVYAALRQHRAQLTRQIEQLGQLAARRGESEAAALDNPLLSHAATMMRAELTWIDRFVAAWRARYPAVDDTPDPAYDPADPARAHTLIHPATKPQAPADVAREQAKHAGQFPRPRNS